jgi:hypothetical protein
MVCTALLLLPACVLAETGDAMKASCEAIDLLSVTTVVQPWTEIPTRPKPEIVVAKPAGTDASGGERTAIVTGPVLSIMESGAVATSFTCTDDGVRVVAMLTRSERSLVDLAKNSPWRPRLALVARLKESSATLEVVWKMRLKSGAPLTRAVTPGYGEQAYPIVLAKRLTASGK